MNFAVFDLESANWIEILIAGIYHKDGQGVSHYKTFEIIKKDKTKQTHFIIKNFMEYLYATDNNITACYAHFGGIFDFLFIIDFLFSQNSDVWSQPKNMIVQGKKILKFDIKHNPTKRKISFICSSGLFPFKLETLTKSFGVKHLKLEMKVSNLKKVTPKLKKYLKHDCIGLYECLEIFGNSEYIRDVGLSLTRSGQSFKVFTKLFHTEKLPFLPSEIKTFSRKSYFGGRTEIFKPLFKKQKRKLHVYDINSLYPSVMRDFSYPGDFIGYTNELQLDTFSIYHCIVTCPDNIYIPLLAVKHVVNKIEKLIFPTGKFEGYWTNVELIKALSLGYKINEVITGVLFDNAGFIFKDYVNHFYNLRIKTNEPVKKIIYKDLLNHLYGRIGINPERSSITFDQEKGEKIHSILDYGKYEIRMYSYEKYLYTYSNPALSSFVTSYARLRLYEYFEKVNFNVYYCDTDSVHTPNKIPVSNKLGKMKLEYDLNEICYLLPKTYMGQKINGDTLRKMKGFPEKNIGHIEFNDFVESLSGEIRIPPVKTKNGLSGFKSAMKKGKVLDVLPDSEKQLRARYDKRLIYKNNKNEYDSKPIHLEYSKQLELDL